jgi:hypothetical protein
LSAHTPGPWNVQGRHSMEVSGPSGSYIVCDVGQSQAPNDPDAYETAQADARLIAAAPDLLKACGAAKAWLAEDPAAGRLVAELHAAIAKASGGGQ